MQDRSVRAARRTGRLGFEGRNRSLDRSRIRMPTGEPFRHGLLLHLGGHDEFERAISEQVELASPGQRDERR